MQKNVLEEQAKTRIKAIHSLSQEYNQKNNADHNLKLLSLMRKHIDEIDELFDKKDKHFLIETGDLIILCFEVLLENKVLIDDVLLECFLRYENKLNSLMSKI